jgi:hypothetical protein
MGVGRAVLLAFEGPPPEPGLYALRKDPNGPYALHNLVWGWREHHDAMAAKPCKCGQPRPLKQNRCRRCNNAYERLRRRGEHQKRHAPYIAALWRYHGGGITLAELAAIFDLSKSGTAKRVQAFRRTNNLETPCRAEAGRRAWLAQRETKKLKLRYAKLRMEEAVAWAIRNGAASAAECYGVDARTIVRWKRKLGVSGASHL